jgi:hypothetical protein
VCLHPSAQTTWPQIYACFVSCLLSFLHLLSPSVRFLGQALEECKTHIVNFKISSILVWSLHCQTGLQIPYFLNYIMLWVHCYIYKGSYNISNMSELNLSPPSFSSISSPHSWNSFNRPHFSIYIHVYIVFEPYSPSYTLSPSPCSHGYQTPRQDLFCPSILQFLKEKKWHFLFV